MLEIRLSLSFGRFPDLLGSGSLKFFVEQSISHTTLSASTFGANTFANMILKILEQCLKLSLGPCSIH